MKQKKNKSNKRQLKKIEAGQEYLEEDLGKELDKEEDQVVKKMLKNRKTLIKRNKTKRKKKKKKNKRMFKKKMGSFLNGNICMVLLNYLQITEKETKLL